MVNLFNHPAVALKAAINAATENVVNGGGPFGAVVVFPDGRHYFGVNRVTANNDPTAHAEVQAIRNACEQEGSFSLAGAVLYASCEPCPMCLCASLWSRVDRVIYAADRFDAAAAGFDDAEFYSLLDQGGVAEVMAEADRLEPFNAWRGRLERVDY
jgi:guanine deaminase